MENTPTLLDWITLLIAGWGAFVASVLGYRELTKERRKVKVIIEYQLFSNRHLFIITNAGFRPITIQDIHVYVEDKQGDMSRDTPWDDTQAPSFPFTIDDGETKTFLLTDYMTSYIIDPKFALKILVHDGEGRTYKKYSKAEHNEKYHWHAMKSNAPDFIIRIKYGLLRFFARFRR